MSDSPPPSERYFRSSLGLKQAITADLRSDYHSRLVDWMKEHDNRLEVGPLRFRLAKEIGFCYGVDKAVDLAYEARSKFPDRRIFLTHEIIHNPRVNARLCEMGIHFLSGKMADSQFTFDDIRGEDVVIVPAFGVSTEEFSQLRARGCIIVDTTCGSVIHVWKRVEAYARGGFTSLIHGKSDHEETVATKSRALAHGGHYLVVRNLLEADQVCAVIRGQASPETILELVVRAASSGFDPAAHLERIGVANQTTMLSSESLEIADRVRAALEARHGGEGARERFRAFDTICSATQNRQDAVMDLVNEGLDLMLVVGGYNSSNTGHLREIASRFCPTYHIDDSSAIESSETIRHKPGHGAAITASGGWLPPGTATLGITAGASTPNRAIGEAIARVVEVRGLTLPKEVRQS